MTCRCGHVKALHHDGSDSECLICPTQLNMVGLYRPCFRFRWRWHRLTASYSQDG